MEWAEVSATRIRCRVNRRTGTRAHRTADHDGEWNMTCNIQWRDAQLNVLQETALSIGYEVTHWPVLRALGENTTAPDLTRTGSMPTSWIPTPSLWRFMFAGHGPEHREFRFLLSGPPRRPARHGVQSASVPDVSRSEYDSWVTIGSDDNTGSVDFVSVDFLPLRAAET